MLRICSLKVVPFDVDNTIVYQTPPVHFLHKADFVLNWHGTKIPMWLHREHIDEIKALKAKGCFIILWSQQGDEWADAVGRAAGLENYVDISMTKPEYCFDDLPFLYWIKRKFLGIIDD